VNKLRYFSMFSGVGGFEIGIERAAAAHGIPVECVGYSEIEKNAIKIYERHWPEHVNFGDATAIDPDDIPDFDLLVGGFPCQAFSIAGKQLGFADTRGTLFFDIARILERKRPRHFILENVKNLVSHDKGRTFRTIVQTLDALGYLVEWQVLNSKDFGVPQNRERIIIVGHLGGLGGRAVLPFAGEGNPHSPNSLSAEAAVARTLTAGGNSGGNHSGMTILAEDAPLSLSLYREWREGKPDEVRRRAKELLGEV
jgi:DNA (cytosine-5)-methyltransferase 1